MTKIIFPIIEEERVNEFTIQLGEVINNEPEKCQTSDAVVTTYEYGKAKQEQIYNGNIERILKQNTQDRVDTIIDILINKSEKTKFLKSCIPTATLPLFDEVLKMYYQLIAWEIDRNSQKKEVLSLDKLYTNITALDDYMELVSNLQTEHGEKITSNDRQRILSKLNTYGVLLANAKLFKNITVTSVDTFLLEQYKQSIALFKARPLDMFSEEAYLKLIMENTKLWHRVRPSVELTFPETVGKFLEKTYSSKN